MPIHTAFDCGSDDRAKMSKIKEVMLLALVADGSIEMKSPLPGRPDRPR
jgi:hypothetical protein